jgi:predicted secreted Zn-dependent protease
MTNTEYRVVPIEKEDGYEHPYQEFTNLEAARQYAYENEHIYCEIRKVTVETIETIRTPEQIEEPKHELTPAEIKKVWEFDGMEENAIYTASRMKIAGKMRFVLFRQ